ncbi:hypothetical protein BJY52DRAFT_1419196, partial [Lactarius psammicola]
MQSGCGSQSPRRVLTSPTPPSALASKNSLLSVEFPWRPPKMPSPLSLKICRARTIPGDRVPILRPQISIWCSRPLHEADTEPTLVLPWRRGLSCLSVRRPEEACSNVSLLRSAVQQSSAGDRGVTGKDSSSGLVGEAGHERRHLLPCSTTPAERASALGRRVRGVKIGSQDILGLGARGGFQASTSPLAANTRRVILSRKSSITNPALLSRPTVTRNTFEGRLGGNFAREENTAYHDARRTTFSLSSQVIIFITIKAVAAASAHTFYLDATV